MMNFTKRLILTIVTLLPFVASAQLDFVFTVNEPAGIAGSYEVAHSGFGTSCNTDTITGPLVFVMDPTDPASDGCEQTEQDLTGAIAMVDRGSCPFTQKVLNAQNAGAIAVIICNNKDEAVSGPGGSDDAVTIRSFMLSKSDCATIRAEVPGAVASIIPVLTRDDDRPVFWSEDFNSGLGEWTTTTETEGDEFFWSEDGTYTGAFGQGISIALGGAGCTGSVCFPAGWFQTGRTGDPADIPASYSQYSAEIISPAIDLSAVTSGVAIEFDQATRILNGGANTATIAYSIDNGENWSGNIQVNPELETNAAVLTSIIRIGLPGVEGNAQVKVKFIFRGDFYFWAIDNVKLMEREADNMSLSDFFAVSPYTDVPESQVAPISFVADVFNIGSAEQTDVKLDISISKDGAEVYSVSKDYGTIAGDDSAQDLPVDGSYTPEGIGEYVGKYVVSAAKEDFDESDNSREFSFSVTDGVFAKEKGATRSTGPNPDLYDDGVPHSWAIGNVFDIVNDKVGDKSVILESVVIGIGNSSELGGQNIIVILYEWDDANGDGAMNAGEYTSIAANAYEFDSALEDNALVQVELEDEEEDGNEDVNLNANSTYVVMVQYTDPDGASEDNEFALRASEAIDYRAQVFLNAATTAEVVPTQEGGVAAVMGYGVGEPRYNHVGALKTDPEVTFSELDYGLGNFGYDLTPVIRMVLGEKLYTDTDDVLASDNVISLFPNPTQNELNVKIELKEVVANAIMNVVDVTGKVIISEQYSNVKEGTFKVNTSALVNGIYNLNIITDNGFRSTKFVVQK